MMDGSRRIHETYVQTLKDLSADFVGRLRHVANREQVDAAERWFTGAVKEARRVRDVALGRHTKRVDGGVMLAEAG